MPTPPRPIFKGSPSANRQKHPPCLIAQSKQQQHSPPNILKILCCTNLLPKYPKIQCCTQPFLKHLFVSSVDTWEDPLEPSSFRYFFDRRHPWQHSSCHLHSPLFARFAVMKTFSCTSIPFRSFCPLQPILGRVKIEIAMMTDSLPSLQFSEVFTRSALPHSRPGYYMQCRLLTVSPLWLKLSYREYALVKGSLKDKQVTKRETYSNQETIVLIWVGWLLRWPAGWGTIIIAISLCTGLCWCSWWIGGRSTLECDSHLKKSLTWVTMPPILPKFSFLS